MTATSGEIFAPFRRLSRAICRISTGKMVAASLFLWLVFAALINGRPFGIAGLEEITGGATVPDMTFSTNPDQVYAVIDALGEAGRAFDLTRVIPLDLVFPFTYALFLSVAITWVLLRLLPLESPWMGVNLLPLIAATADYCENAGVIAMLLAYPARLDAVAMGMILMSGVKFTFLALSFGVLFIALLVLAGKPVLRRGDA
jgi:hypothetical protein